MTRTGSPAAVRGADAGGVLVVFCAVLSLAGWAVTAFIVVLGFAVTDEPMLARNVVAATAAISATVGVIGLVGWILSSRPAAALAGETVAARLHTGAAAGHPGSPQAPSAATPAPQPARGPDTFVSRAVAPTLKAPPAAGETLPELPGASTTPEAPPAPAPPDDPFRPRTPPPAHPGHP